MSFEAELEDYYDEDSAETEKDLLGIKDYYCECCEESFYEEEVFFDHDYDFEEVIMGERPLPYCPECGHFLEDI